ncbi:MAG: sterol desaturase family protein [Candidatus Sericytochromatia bacterium]
MLEMLSFGLLFGLLLLSRTERERLRHKRPFEWLLDGSNLLIQGTLVPLLQLTVLFAALKALWPAGQGLLHLPLWAAFGLNFVAVDYLYYWNHRLFHHRRFFAVHAVHHSVSHMDVMATSRNTLWTSLLIVYLWANCLLLFLTDFNPGFVLAMSLSACLDLWKHSSLLRQHPHWQRQLSRLGLMTPLDHAWHHSSALNHNFGANLNLFDRLHGTYVAHADYPERLGVQLKLSPWQQLVFPWQTRKRSSRASRPTP